MGEAVFASFLGITFGCFILYPGRSWMCQAARDVIQNPVAAPLYTLLACAIWLCAGGVLLWAVRRSLLVVWRVARAIAYFVEDVAYLIAARFERVREAIGSIGGRR
ncbi:hypothetical protein BJF92_09135 [Rhizobium rhizosphaerae]|uniref:Uncharacterized protein n=1 Tax=Xaviernesmea rhizosphaerae TaxID=1672749 RepID=A0A1Q9AKI6_9HYPH|nr:hypothetical protein BJF92_09135 [Xaviernesmea rhizosphaerae]